MSLFTEFLPHPAIEELRALDLDAMTPLEAFDCLRSLAAKTRGAGDA
jgi:hypothetical protein